jgi:site-specific DNA recombinase
VTSVRPGVADCPTDPEVEAELKRLPKMPIRDLRNRYRELFRAELPKAFGPDLLRRSIAHSIQERAYGGLSREDRRLLDQLVRAAQVKPNGRLELPRQIKPGSELVRTWNRRTYRVVVMERGFAWEGRTYSSLSEIALEITGTKWNGPRFFCFAWARPVRSKDTKKHETRRSKDFSLCHLHPQVYRAWPGAGVQFAGRPTGSLRGLYQEPGLAGLVGLADVVVVYKIDRLTRSLADFAKLVETFDARSISFAAVTQQFNTTTSMGRLTLNVLLSFAQFERELASERVRDKVAASRKKGKWTGGTVPLGYEAKDKRLVVNKAEAEAVRTIFRRYLELKSFARLVADLDKRGIVTKRRNTKVTKYQGGIPFTYGPLAYFLKNRIYLGEMHHGGIWFKGEHEAIVERETFDRVQQLLKGAAAHRKVKRSVSGALLMGKLYDDSGNRMSPSFSSKNGVRYRFYVSSALLRGRKEKAGSVRRIAAREIEGVVEEAVRGKLDIADASSQAIEDRIERIVLSETHVRVTLNAKDGGSPAPTIEIPRTSNKASYDCVPVHSEHKPDMKLVQAIVRAHAWQADLKNGRFSSVEELAATAKLHPKVIRQALKLAFLSPKITSGILAGNQQVRALRQIPKRLPLDWISHLT